MGAEPGPARRRVGNRRDLCGLATIRVGAQRPPDDESQIDHRNLQHEQQEDGLPDHVMSLRDWELTARAGRERPRQRC